MYPQKILIELKVLVLFIMNTYVTQWFSIKRIHSMIHTVKHMLKSIITLHYLLKILQVVLDSIMERQAFFSHTRNLLLAMMTHEIEHIREVRFSQI